MGNYFRKFSGFLSLMLIMVTAHAYAVTLSPVGFWKTIDDKTGAARSIVQITENNGQLSGKITYIILQPGEKETDVCKKCHGVLHNQPIVGLTILSGLKKVGDAWRGGYILDPTNGRIYHCKITLSQQGDVLHVRGYIGLPIIGRTQNWKRASSAKG